MPSPRNQVVLGLSQLLTDLTEASPESLFGVDNTPDNGLMGYFSQGNELFEFRLSDANFSYVESDDRGQRAYWSSLKTHDSRLDAQPECKTGKLCGDVCIPRGHRCTKGLSSQQKKTAEETKAVVQEQKKQGNWKSGLLIGGAIGVGVLGLTAVGVGAAIAASGSTSSFQRSQPQPAELVAPKPTIPTPSTQKPAIQEPKSEPPTVTPITPFKGMEVIADPWGEEAAEQPPHKARQTESTTPDSSAKSSQIRVNPENIKPPQTPKKKPPVKPRKTEIEQQTERLLRDFKPYANGAKLVAQSPADVAAIVEAEKTLVRLEVRHRQMMNPLHESYFESSASDVKALSRQLAQSDRAALRLKERLLRGKSLEQHQRESDRALAQLDEHAQRIQTAQVALDSDVKSSPGRDRALSSLQQQRGQVDALKNQVVVVRQAVSNAAALQPKLNELRQRVNALPTRPGQLSEQEQAQHRAIQRLRTMQGKLPGRVAEFAKQHSDQLDELDRRVGAIEQISGNHDSDRSFATNSVGGLVERRLNLIEQDLHLLRLMSGPNGVNWVASKGVSDVANGNEMIIRRAQQETGVREITTIEEAAKFRNHVLGQISDRVEKRLSEIETRSVYPQEVSSRAVEQMNAHISDLYELQNQAVIEGRQVSQGLVRDLNKTAQGMNVQLAGTAVQQPYRQANDFLANDIENAHAQKARAIAESIVSAEADRDRVARLAKEPAVFEMGSRVKSASELAQDVETVRAEIKRMKQVTTVKLGNVKPTEETQRRMAAGEQRIAQNEAVKAQIGHLQAQLGEVALQIKKREEAAARGQKKGISTGRLEAQKAAIQRQMEELAQHFTGIEKRDSLRKRAFSSLPIPVPILNAIGPGSVGVVSIARFLE